MTDTPTFRDVLDRSTAAAMRGGLAGGLAMGANIGCLMWLRTTVNYQYRYGTSMRTAIRTLYTDGGIPRFYRGVIPAIVMGPMSRFGDTAANIGIMTLLDAYNETRELPVTLKTLAASSVAAIFRIGLISNAVRAPGDDPVEYAKFLLIPAVWS